MEKSGKVNQPRKNFVKITGQLLYTEEQLQAFQKELDACPWKGAGSAWWLERQLETGELSSFVIYAPKYVSKEDIVKEAFDRCSMGGKKEYKFEMKIQSKEEMWFEDLPYEMQQKFGACFKTTLSYLPDGIKCWKRWGRRSYDMLVPNGMKLDRGRRVQWEKDEYFENWQIAKDTFFGNDSEALKLRKETIAKEKESIRLANEQKSAEVRQAHQKEVDEYNEKYRLFKGETKEEYYKHPVFEDCYIKWYTTPVLYTEEELHNVKWRIDTRIQEQKEKIEAAEKSKMWQEKISAKLNEKPNDGEKSLAERAADLGYEVRYWQDYMSMDVIGSCCEGHRIVYSDEAAFLLNQFVTQKEIELQKAQEAERQRLEYEKQKAEAEKSGLPSDIRVWYRVGAGTNCSNAWVIKPDGSFREPTGFEAVKRYGDGYKNWEQILEGEAVLSWAKGCATAEHEFEVIYLPEEGLTVAQKEAVLKIEEDIQNEWKNKRGLSSGIPSPDVGMGWNIAGRKMPLKVTRDDMLEPVYADKVKLESKVDTKAQVEENTEPDREITADDLTKLKDFFAGR